jgi:phage terminase large subunit-like protein
MAAMQLSHPNNLSVAQKVAIASQATILEREIAKRTNYKLKRYFPDIGPLRRELYITTNQFFEAGAKYPERLLMGGNRTGKTEGAAYEVTCHLTGLYPDWWKGRRFNGPTDWWGAGDTATTTRDIMQLSLFGPMRDAPKSGMIPAHLIKHHTPKNSIPLGIETLWVQHVTGGVSTFQFKSYDQKRDAFQGTSRNIWFDEECPQDVYTEALLRTLTMEVGGENVSGMLILTFTPVEGLTPFVQHWLENAVMLDTVGNPVPAEAAVFQTDLDEATAEKSSKESVENPPEARQKFIAMVSWDEVPHLSEAARSQMLASIPPYQRAARTRGIPNLGSGVIYPIPEEEIKVKPFEIPKHWPRGYGMDVGWNWTVAVWGAYDRETATWYLYRVHARSHAEPPVHAEGIKAAGSWIPGRIDPAANGRSQMDGKQLLQVYGPQGLGLNIDMAPNAVEAGIFEVWTLLTSSRLKVFSSLSQWFTEYRMYRRNDKGQVVKKNDHLMDGTRYLIASGISWLQVWVPGYDPVAEARAARELDYGGGRSGGSDAWMS